VDIPGQKNQIAPVRFIVEQTGNGVDVLIVEGGIETAKECIEFPGEFGAAGVLHGVLLCGLKLTA